MNYAEQVLELTPRTTRELLSLARRLPGLPVLSASLECGELDWTKAREIVRVATPDTELAWVERAASVTSRVLEGEVATSLVGELPPSRAATCRVRDGLGRRRSGPGPDQGHLTRSVPETTRRKVFHRAHWKCEVPGCGNRLWLDIHHMRPRASGGRHGFENLAAICSTHHRRIHEGTLGVELKCEVIRPDSGQEPRVIEATYADARRSRTS